MKDGQGTLDELHAGVRAGLSFLYSTADLWVRDPDLEIDGLDADLVRNLCYVMGGMIDHASDLQVQTWKAKREKQDRTNAGRSDNNGQSDY